LEGHPRPWLTLGQGESGVAEGDGSDQVNSAETSASGGTGPAHSPAAPDPQAASIWDRVKRHKVVEWTLAYIAFGYAALHGAEMLRDAFEWSPAVPRFTFLALALGLPIAMTLAWYHGHRAQHRVSRTELATLVALLVLAGSALWLIARHERTHVSAGVMTESIASAKPLGDKSIAVLPFVDMSEKKDQEYFGDGIAEEILDLLAKIPSLTVIGRTSSFQFKGKNEDLRIIGTTLGAAYVLEGSVRKSGDRVRITTQLIKAQTGAHQWSETYDRAFSDVLKMQDEIAAGLVRALQLTLDTDTLQPRPTLSNTDSYNLYLQGRYAFNRYDKEGFEAAIRYFQQALELDPTSAVAASSLARAYALQGDFGYSQSAATWEHARSAVETALKLDPKSTAAHTTLAMIHCFYDWDWSAAETELRQAQASSRRDSWTLLVESILSSTLGRLDDAFTKLNASLAIDPLDPGAWQNLAYLQLRRGHLSEAETAARRTLEIAPTYDGVYFILGLILLARGDREAALGAMQQESPEDRDLGLAVVYHEMNRKVEANAALAAYTHAHSDDEPLGIADVHAYRGEADAAFAWLDRAYLQRASGLYWLKGDTLLRNLEGDPRYKAFLRKMNLPE
jgi:adenylate cyclase